MNDNGEVQIIPAASMVAEAVAAIHSLTTDLVELTSAGIGETDAAHRIANAIGDLAVAVSTMVNPAAYVK